MTKPHRAYISVRWVGFGWTITLDRILVGFAVRKSAAVARARRIAQSAQPSELVVYTRSGRIGKGPGSRSTYGSDPRSSKG